MPTQSSNQITMLASCDSKWRHKLMQRGCFRRRSLLDPEDQDWTAIVACLIEVLYVTLNMSVYWNFAFKYLTTSLELEEFIKQM